MPLRVIGLLSGPNGHTLRLGGLLSPHEETQCRGVLALLETFRDSREIGPLINGNLLEFSHVNEQLTALLSTPRAGRAARVNLYRELNRSFANLLSSVRLYRDHTRKRLSHSYGRRSPQLAFFDAAWSDAVTKDFALGFIWEFRNYVQHVGMPFDIASVSIAIPPNPATGRKVNLGIARATLLRYEKWGSLKARIRQLPDVVPVQDYVEPAMKTLVGIDSQLTEQERPALFAAGTALVKFLRPGFADGAYPGIAEVASETPPIGMVPCHLAPIEVLDFLGLASTAQTSDGPRTKLADRP